MDLSLLPLAFSLILTVASKLFHPYSTNDKTSRLVVKRISTVGEHPERFAELHGEEKREEGDRGDQEEKRGNQNGQKQSSQESILPLLSTVWNTQRGSQSSTEKRRGGKEIEVIRRSGGGVKRRKTDLASNQFPKCSPQPGIHKEIHRVG